MGKSLAEYQKSFDAISKRTSDLSESYVSAARSAQSIEGMFPYAIEAIGERVRELKTAGSTGTTLADFKTDKEVAAQISALVGLSGLGTHYKDLLALQKAAVKLGKDRTDLAKSIAEDTKSLEKKKDPTAAGFNKLLKEVRELTHTGPWAKVDDLLIAKPAQYDLAAVEKSNLIKVQQTISAVKAGPAPKKEMEYDEAKAKMQSQHASAQAASAGSLLTKLEALCTQALAAGDVAQAKEVLTTAAKIATELHKMVAANKEAAKQTFADPSNPVAKKTLGHFASIEATSKKADAVLAQAVRTALRPTTTV